MNTRVPERIETARLILRKPRRSDVDAIFSGWASDPSVTRYMSWPTHVSAEATAAFLEHSDDQWAHWPAGPLLIECQHSGTLIGSTGLGFDSPVEAEVGYVLAAKFWGLGYATEALSAIVEVAHELGVRRLHAGVHPCNTASARVLEKCGFDREWRSATAGNLPECGWGFSRCGIGVLARVRRGGAAPTSAPTQTGRQLRYPRLRGRGAP